MSGTVLYDGECSLCNSQVRFITGHGGDGQFNLVPLQSEMGRNILQSAGLKEDDFDTVVYHRNGRYLKRSTAVLNILWDLGRGWRLLYGFIIIPAFIRDFFYDLVARNRYRLPDRKGRAPKFRHPPDSSARRV
jgi:predicted DCC family thiol-disulfide oxidoreductase YuxK